MAEGVKPTGKGNSHYGSNSHTTLKEKLRVGYNPRTKTFGPMGSSSAAKIDHMVQIEGAISKVRVPTDYTSPAFLQNVSTQTEAKGERLEPSTKGVDKYFSGDQAQYPQFISSVKTKDLL